MDETPCRQHFWRATPPSQLLTTDQLNARLAGRYVIDRLVGEGGMATVYLARDVRHNRKVALKVLKPDLGAIVGVDRFLAEIQVTANLQHPNLLPLFDSGAAEGLLFYVMPYIEGESLRARLDREKQLPVEEAVKISTAIASALDYAHRQGVIHRDLKPENILLHDGNPLVADFGIALAVSNAGGSRITQTGLSLGTPQYMSPEQATGDRVLDARSDIYSLGALTYEMLTGEPPHIGSTSQAVMARVLTERPRSIRASRASVPPHVEAAVDRALEKLPADRWRSAKEFGEALSGAKALTFTGARAPAVPAYTGVIKQLPHVPDVPPLVSRRGLGIGAAGIVVAALAGGVGAIAMRKPPAEPPSRFVIDLPDSLPLNRTTRFRQVALSRDDARAVFIFGPNYPGPVYTRRPGELQFDAIPGTESARSMVLSPKGDYLLFWPTDGSAANSGNQLMKIAIEGGAPVKIADSADVISQASWGDGDQVLFRRGDALYIVSANGGPDRLVARPDSALDQGALGWPEMLPGGKAALITILHGSDQTPDSFYVGTVSITDGKVVDLGIRGLTPHYAAGHLLYVRQDGQLFARRFEAAKLKFTGEPIAIAKDVSARRPVTPRDGGVTDLAVSETGTILFTEGGAALGGGGSGRSIVLRKAQNPQQPIFLQQPRLNYIDLRASPDGDRLALTIQDSTSAARRNIHLLTFATGQLRQFTYDGRSSQPVWSPDGKRVIYKVTNPAATPVIRYYSRAWDESDSAKAVPGADGAEAVEFPGPAGKYIAYLRGDSGATVNMLTNSDLYIAPIDSPTMARPFAATGLRERMPRFSPDGKWLAYTGHDLSQSAGVGPGLLYARQVPGLGGAVTQVSLQEGNTPLWSHDGRSLFYFSGSGGAPLVSVKVSDSKGVDVPSTSLVFSRPAPATAFGTPVTPWQVDVLPNGDFLYITSGADPNPSGASPIAGVPVGRGAVAAPTAQLPHRLIALVNWLAAPRQASVPK
jgi:dipeptidyl aminopeptidase/acylaminoacyl peptidase